MRHEWAGVRGVAASAHSARRGTCAASNGGETRARWPRPASPLCASFSKVRLASLRLNSRKEPRRAGELSKLAAAQELEPPEPEAPEPRNRAMAAIRHSGHSSLHKPELHIRTEPDKRTAHSRKARTRKDRRRIRSRVRCLGRKSAARSSRHKREVRHSHDHR
jgi:hypothetical protein